VNDLNILFSFINENMLFFEIIFSKHFCPARLPTTTITATTVCLSKQRKRDATRKNDEEKEEKNNACL
jgi:hypothetical protein